MTDNTTTPSLRTRIIALGEKGLHRTMLAAYAPKIEAIFQAELQALLEQAVPTQIISNAKGSQVNLSSGLAVPVEAIKQAIERINHG